MREERGLGKDEGEGKFGSFPSFNLRQGYFARCRIFSSFLSFYLFLFLVCFYSLSFSQFFFLFFARFSSRERDRERENEEKKRKLDDESVCPSSVTTEVAIDVIVTSSNRKSE